MDKEQQLKSYILEHLQSGVSPDEITQQLRGSGWDEASISNAFKAVQSTIVPTPVSQTSVPGGGPVTEATGKKRGRLKTSWLLLKQSLKVLKNNKELVRYPVMGGLLSLIVTIPFGAMFFFGENTLYYVTKNFEGKEDASLTLLGLAVTFVYYVIIYFIIFMYNTGLAANVLDIFRGKSEKYHAYMARAWAKKVPIFVYSLITATVGMILRAIEERSRLIGYLVSRILGTLWGLANLFTIPIIAENDITAPAAIKKSTKLFISKWGENIAARITFGGLAFLIFLLMFIPIVIVSVMLGATLGPIGIILALIIIFTIILVFSLVQSAASSILSTALYFYAEYQQVPAAFDKDLLNSVFIPKKQKRGLFSKKPPKV